MRLKTELSYLGYDACLAFLRSVWYTADHVIPVGRNRGTGISAWAWGQLGPKTLGICACVAFAPTATVHVPHLYVVTIRRCYLWLLLAMMGAFKLSREERERCCLIPNSEFRSHSDFTTLIDWVNVKVFQKYVSCSCGEGLTWIRLEYERDISSNKLHVLNSFIRLTIDVSDCMDSKIPLLRISTEVLVASVIVCFSVLNHRRYTDLCGTTLSVRNFSTASRMVLEQGKRDSPFTN